MTTIELDIDGKKITGVELQLPGAPLVLAYGKGGFVMCGYLNVETAEKLGIAAGLVRGVKTVDDLLKASIQSATSFARNKGISDGMTGRDALSRLG
jgi:uncharacterized protein YunC (DUF1805 family)